MRSFFVFLFLVFAHPAFAEVAEPHCTSGKWSKVECIDPLNFDVGICTQLENQANVNGLDPHFFARLIWQESRFNPNAVSPANAQGIAQFIPSTARLEGLTDAFDPALALEHSAHHLADLKAQSGSYGMAAAGYNAGQGRVDDFMRKGRRLPGETRNYVQIITGVSGENWLANPKQTPNWQLNGDIPFFQACMDLAQKRVLTKLFRPPEAVPLSRWGVQVAYGTSRSRARAAFKRRTRICQSAVSGVHVHYLKVKNAASGPRGFYVARLHAVSRSAADRLCRRISRAGCTCRVYRNK